MKLTGTVDKLCMCILYLWLIKGLKYSETQKKDPCVLTATHMLVRHHTSQVLENTF